MKSKNLTLLISMILLIDNPALAMEGKGEKSAEIANSPIIQSIVYHEEKKLSVDLESLSVVSIDKTAEPSTEKRVESPTKRKDFITIPIRRKSAVSPRGKEINSPKQNTTFLEEQGKDPDPITVRKAFSSLIEDDQNDSSRCVISTSQEEKKPSPRSGFKRYSLIGPIEFLRIPQNSSQEESKDFSIGTEQISPGRDGAISPTHPQSRDPIL
jgi:hypothetical protein